MKTMKLLLAIAFWPTILWGQQTATLESLKTKYAGVKEQIERDVVTQKAENSAAYGTLLGSMMTQIRQKGDLDNFLAVEKEKKRFDIEKTMPAKPENDYVTRAVHACQEAAARIEADKATRMLTLQRAYVAQLEPLIKSLMQADKIDEAKAVKDEVERIKFEITCIETSLPKKEEAPKVVPPAEKPTEKETSKEKATGSTAPKTKLVPKRPVPNVAKEFNGHHYLGFFERDPNWSKAKKYCELKGGHLAIIRDEKENAFVWSVSFGKALWIGCTDEGAPGQWKWVDGSNVTYSAWAPGQPDNVGAAEHYGAIGIGGRANWSSLPVESRGIIGYVCEWDY